MTRFRWWLRKEFREHRVPLVLLGLVLVGGTWLYLHLRADSAAEHAQRMAEWRQSPSSARPGHPLQRHVWEALLFFGLLASALVIAGGTFAGERRRGTAALMARQPGAWGAAFFAKIAFVLFVLGCGFLLQAATLGRLADLYDLRDDGQPVRTWLLVPQQTEAFGWPLAAGLAVWMLAASTLLPWAALPSLVGAVLGVAAVLPAILWHDDFPYFLRWGIGGAGRYVFAWAALAAGLLAWGWFRAMRRWRPPARVALRAVLVVGAFIALAAGGLAALGARYLDFDGHVPDLRLALVRFSVDGRYAYAGVYRGDPDEGEEPSRHGTPPRAWRIDLLRGTHSVLGAESAMVGTGDSRLGSFHELSRPLLLTLLDTRDWSQSGTWIDARTGEVFATGSPEVPEEAEARMRAGIRAATQVHDSAGRTAWILAGRLEKEDGTSVGLQDLLAGTERYEIPGGWVVWLANPPSADAAGGDLRAAQTIAADDGRVRRVARKHGTWELRDFLAPDTALLVAAPGNLYDSEVPLGQHRLLNADTGEVTPLLSDSEGPSAELIPIAFLSRTVALVAVGGENAREPAVVSLPDGKVTILRWAGTEAAGIEHLTWYDSGHRIVHGSDRRLLLSLWRDDPTRAPRGRLPRHTLHAYVTVDPRDHRLRLLRGWSPDDGGLWVVEPVGSLLGTEQERRIVRLGPEPGRREVLFPKR